MAVSVMAVCSSNTQYFIFPSIGEITPEESHSTVVHSSMSLTTDRPTHSFSPQERFVFHKQELKAPYGFKKNSRQC